MMICPYCGAETADGSAFCGNCGASLKDAISSGGFEPGQSGGFDAKPARSGQEIYDQQPIQSAPQMQPIEQAYPQNQTAYQQTQPDQPAYQQTQPDQPAYQQTQPGQPAYQQTQPDQSAYQQTQPGQSAYQQAAPTYQQAPPTYQSNAAWSNVPQVVAPVSTGGLLAWSIITILLCTIPGIVAMVNTLAINKAQTVEEQQKKMGTARLWCIIGTVLGVLLVIGNIMGR